MSGPATDALNHAHNSRVAWQLGSAHKRELWCRLAGINVVAQYDWEELTATEQMKLRAALGTVVAFVADFPELNPWLRPLAELSEQARG